MRPKPPGSGRRCAPSSARHPKTLLGGGNLVSHLHGRTRLTLVEPAPGMRAHSRALNPDAEHVEGDMRTVRLDRTFDAILVHDAIMYMTTQDELAAALSTARVHLAAHGVAIVLPDHVAETFQPGIETGGNDGADGRSLRYVCWSHAPAGGSTVHHADYAILLRDADGRVEVVHDRHTIGLFRRDAWRDAFTSAGFGALTVRADPWRQDVFLARPAERTAR
jgi:trans-aconitate methyltransferase